MRWNIMEEQTKIMELLETSMVWDTENFIDKLKVAIHTGFPIDYRNEDGNTLLLISLFTPAIAEFAIPSTLIDLGANVNVCNGDGSRALDVAIMEMWPLELVDKILHSGAEINAKNNEGLTAFSVAAQLYINSNDIDVQEYAIYAANLLLKFGADPYACTKWKDLDWYWYNTEDSIDTEKQNTQLHKFVKVLNL